MESNSKNCKKFLIKTKLTGSAQIMNPGRSNSNPMVLSSSSLEQHDYMKLFGDLDNKTQTERKKCPFSMKNIGNPNGGALPGKPSNLKINNEKFFKLNIKHINSNELTPLVKRHHGKTVSLQMLKKIVEKETVISQMEAHHSPHLSQGSALLTPTKIFIQEKIGKSNKKNINMSPMNSKINEYFFNSMNEESFQKFIKHFYERKILKSNILMKHFQDKNTEKIVTNIGKCFFKKVRSKHDESVILLEYLEKMHEPLNINDEDFETYKGLFLISMREFGFSEEDTQIITSKIEGYRSFIVKKNDFSSICIKKSFTINDYISSVCEAAQENGFLNQIFLKMGKELSFKWFFSLISLIMTGYNEHLISRKEELMNKISIYNNYENLDWKQCFEMKNILINCFLDRKALTFKPSTEKFLSKMHYLHLYIMNEPNIYQPDIENSSIDINLMVSLLCKSLVRNKDLSKIFGFWSVARLQNHCRYMVDYLMKSKSNPFLLCDMAPIHSGCFITNKEFSLVYEILQSLLKDMKGNEEEIAYILCDLERLRHHVSRESLKAEKIEDLSSICDLFIESLYVYMFGNNDTKAYFKNTEMCYIKYKQKLFFLKLFKNELESADLIDLKAIHSKMGIKKQHFDHFLKFAEECLLEINLNPFYVSRYLKKMSHLKSFICIEEI